MFHCASRIFGFVTWRGKVPMSIAKSSDSTEEETPRTNPSHTCTSTAYQGPPQNNKKSSAHGIPHTLILNSIYKYLLPPVFALSFRFLVFILKVLYCTSIIHTISSNLQTEQTGCSLKPTRGASPSSALHLHFSLSPPPPAPRTRLLPDPSCKSRNLAQWDSKRLKPEFRLQRRQTRRQCRARRRSPSC